MEINSNEKQHKVLRWAEAGNSHLQNREKPLWIGVTGRTVEEGEGKKERNCRMARGASCSEVKVVQV